MTTTTPETRQPRARAGHGIASWLSHWPWAVVALLAYPAIFLNKPGWLAADTKAYLYLDPGRLLSSAQSMWNPDVGLGTVTHQNIGYLFPMGPYYWLVHSLGVPMWIGQRFWIGSLFFLAGGGVLYLGRLLGLTNLGRCVAAVLYMLSPYVIDYITRTSAILLPWAGLGWMLGLTIVAARRGGWRAPALFALVIAAVGGVNATSILFVGIAPVLWLLYAAFLKEISWRDVWRVVWRVGILSIIVSLWWAAGLWAESVYGINILRFTETIPTVVATSLASEVMRGLGYWYFYGRDKIQPWTQPAVPYMWTSWVVALSFLVPTLAVFFGFFARWRYRAFAAVMVVVGVIFAVSAYPLSHPTPFGSLLKAAGEKSTIGLAMRSSNRVLPIVVLGLALLLGAGISALGSWRHWVGALCAALALLLAIGNLSPLFEGTLVARNLAFPGQLPIYTTRAANYLNARNTDTRVLGIPGLDFGYYRWGVTMDPVWPGLLTRPYVARQAVALGEPATVNLLRALDESIQDGVFDPSSLAPMARLMSAGDVLLQNDVQYERFDTPRPQVLWEQLNPAPRGLSAPVSFGPPVGEQTLVGPILDETQLAIPANAALAPSLAVFGVVNPRPLIRAESTSSPLIVAGDGEGLLTAGSFGLLDGTNPIFYSASLPTASSFARANEPGAIYVLTDSNAKRLDTWGTLHTTYGYVQTPAERLIASNPSEQAMDLFPRITAATQTVSVLSGVQSVEATAYGNPIANAPESQPINAFDGNPATSWTEGAFSKGTGEHLRITLTHPVSASFINLLQPQTGPRNRHITAVTMRFDGKHPVHATLSRSSLSLPGQEIHFAPRTFRQLDIAVTGVSGNKVNFTGLSGVGFAEVGIEGVPSATQALRLPTDLMSKAGPASASHPLVILLSRLRSNGLPPRLDPELSMHRIVTLPSARAAQVTGTARISGLISDALINQLVGRSSSTTMPPGQAQAARVVQTNSSGRLPGDLNASSWSAFDTNPSTSWQTGFLKQAGAWISADLSRPISFDHLDLQILADGRHQIPTQITISTSSGRQTIALPHIDPGRGRPQGSVTPLSVSFPTMSGSSFRMTIDATSRTKVRDNVTGERIVPPLGIAEVGLPGVSEPLTPATLPGTCQAGLLSINGASTGVTISGSTSEALAGGGMRLSSCSPSSLSQLPQGSSVITTGDGSQLGWNVDQLAFASLGIAPAAPIPGTGARVSRLVSSNRWSATVKLVGGGAPSWLVLGQSLSKGWQASLNGRDLGAPQLIDGYANGWKLPALAAGTSATVHFVWAPQHIVNIAELLSALGLLAAAVIALWPRRRRRRSLLPAMFAPVLSNPLRYADAAPGWPTSIIASLLLGGLASAISAPLNGPAIALIALLAFRLRLGRILLLVGSVGALAAAGVVTVLLQHLHHFPRDIGWPSHFGTANSLAWGAVILLLVDAVVELMRHARVSTTSSDPSSPTDELSESRTQAAPSSSELSGQGPDPMGAP